MPNVALLPVTRDPQQLITYIEENFRRIANTMALPTPAASVTPGAFPTGDFTVDGDLAVTSQIAAGGTSFDPEPITSHGTSSGISMKDRDNAALRWVIYPTANQLWFWDGGNRVSIDRNTGLIRTNLTAVGPHPVFNAYAWFGHRDMAGSAQYGFLQSATGETIVNATGAVYIRRNGVSGTNELCLDASGLYVSDDIAIPSDRAIYLKGAWDAQHIIHHWGSMDGIIYNTWTEHRFKTSGGDAVRIMDAGLYMTQGWVRTYNERGMYNESSNSGISFEDHGMGHGRLVSSWSQRPIQLYRNANGNWQQAAFNVKSTVGGAKISLWSTDQGSAPIIKQWNETFEARNNPDTGWAWWTGFINNTSTIKAKSNVRNSSERITKSQRKQRIKNQRTVHYNRRQNDKWCANCSNTGKRQPGQRLEGEPGYEGKHDATTADHLQLLFKGGDLGDCPTCNGDPASITPPSIIKNEEAGWLGFIAEELEQTFPECVVYRDEGPGTDAYPIGVDSLALIALLWEEVKDLEDRLVLMEKVPK